MTGSRRLLVWLCLLFCCAVPARAAEWPQVMLMLDYKSNTNANTSPCDFSLNQTAGGSCHEWMGLPLYTNYARVVCAKASSGCIVADDGVASGTLADYEYDNMDLQRAQFITALEDQRHSNIRVGLAMSHAEGGAMIMKGFTPLSEGDCAWGYRYDYDESSGVYTRTQNGCDLSTYGSFGPRRQLIQRLLNIPKVQGNCSHPFKPRSLLFELFRYLRGGEIFFGHQSAGDWGGGNTSLQTNDPAYIACDGLPSYINLGAQFSSSEIGASSGSSSLEYSGAVGGFYDAGFRADDTVTVSGFGLNYQLTADTITAQAGNVFTYSGAGGFMTTANLMVGDIVTVNGYAPQSTIVFTPRFCYGTSAATCFASMAACNAAKPANKTCFDKTTAVTTTTTPNNGHYMVTSVTDTTLAVSPITAPAPATGNTTAVAAGQSITIQRSAQSCVGSGQNQICSYSPYLSTSANNGTFRIETVDNATIRLLTADGSAYATLEDQVAGNSISISALDSGLCGDMPSDRCNSWDATTPWDVANDPAVKLAAVEDDASTHYITPFDSIQCANTTVLAQWNQESNNDEALSHIQTLLPVEMPGITGTGVLDMVQWLHTQDVDQDASNDAQRVTFYTVTDGSGAGEAVADAVAQAGGGQHLIVGGDAQQDMTALSGLLQNLVDSGRDADGDGLANGCDGDDDNDGVADSGDAFPRDASESVDLDGDGVGDNRDLDDDGDGVPDYIDADPRSAGINSERWLERDGDYRGSTVTEGSQL